MLSRGREILDSFFAKRAIIVKSADRIAYLGTTLTGLNPL
jgi:hypothetical protein